MQLTITPAAAAFLASAPPEAQAFPQAQAEALAQQPDTAGLLVEQVTDPAFPVPLLRFIVQTTREPSYRFHVRTDHLLTPARFDLAFAVSEHVRLYQRHRARQGWPD